jgi:Ca-activated chloride channel family protein
VTFATPALLWLGIATAFVVFAIHLLDRRRQQVLMERLGELPAVRRMMAARSPWRRALKSALFGVGLGLVIVSAARPEVTGTSVSKRKGMDLVIALDVSKSMLVGDVEVAEPPGGWPEDLEPDAPRGVPERPEWVRGTRLERARQMLGALAAELPDDRISVVLFAGASIHFPMTDDENLAVRLAHLVGPEDLMGGSDVGEALRVGKCLLRAELDDAAIGCYGIGQRGHGGDPLPGERPKKRKQRAEEVEKEERGKAILVITDGGTADPSVIEEANLAQQLGISLYFVGVGSEQGGVVPELDYEGRVVGSKRDGRGNVVTSKLDRAGLRGLAELAGGAKHYVELSATGPFDVRPIVEALAAVHRGALERTEHEKKRDVYHWFLFPGFMLLVIEAAIGLRRRVEHPEALP